MTKETKQLIWTDLSAEESLKVRKAQVIIEALGDKLNRLGLNPSYFELIKFDEKINKIKGALHPEKYFSSGFYSRPFYKCHDIDFEEEEDLRNFVFYDIDLLTRGLKAKELGRKNNLSKEEIKEIIGNLIWGEFNLPFMLYVEAKIGFFDEEIAVKCGLIPFCFKDPNGRNKSLFAVNNTKGKGRLRLDAYQALAHGTIDPNSTFFTDKKNFERIVGKDIVEEMKEKLTTCVIRA